jgi:hypothetical protein
VATANRNSSLASSNTVSRNSSRVAFRSKARRSSNTASRNNNTGSRRPPHRRSSSNTVSRSSNSTGNRRQDSLVREQEATGSRKLRADTDNPAHRHKVSMVSRRPANPDNMDSRSRATVSSLASTAKAKT